MPDSDPGPVCGNMAVETGEDCDDGNTDDGDGCDASCQDEISFFSNEGGEVRFEYLRLTDAADGDANNITTMTRVISFIRSDDATDFHDYPVDFMTPGTCFQVTDDTKWPTSQPMNAKYEDIGNLIVSASDGSSTTALNVPKAIIANDPLQRAHGVGNWYYHARAGNTPGAMFNDTDMFVAADTTYDVTFTGSDSWPSQVFPGAIHIPADFSLKDDGGTNSPDEIDVDVPLEAATQLTVKWEVVASANKPAGTTDQWTMVGFIAGGSAAAKGAVVVCVNTANAGEQIVPAAMVDVIRDEAPDGGTIVRQVFHHNVRELTNGTTVKGRRIDMIGVWCYARPFSIAP